MQSAQKERTFCKKPMILDRARFWQKETRGHGVFSECLFFFLLALSCFCNSLSEKVR